MIGVSRVLMAGKNFGPAASAWQDAIVSVDQHNVRLERFCVGFVKGGICSDNNFVSGHGETGSRTIQTYDT